MSKALDVVMKSRKELTDEIVENMKKGYIFTEKWDASMFQAHNGESNHVYQGSNRLRLVFEQSKKGYKDNRWYTYLQIQKMGLKLKPGSKATLIENWQFDRYEKITDKDGNTLLDDKGNEILNKVHLSHPIVRYYNVFNGDQIEGLEPQKLPEIKDSDVFKTAEVLKNSSECEIKELNQDESYYSPDGDYIVLPPKECFKSDKDYITTLMHEMAHSTSNENRLGRDIRNFFGTKDYAKEELRAELSSYFMGADLGINDLDININHSAYLNSWMQVLKDDPNELFKACNEASGISEYLIKNYNLEKEKEDDKEMSL